MPLTEGIPLYIDKSTFTFFPIMNLMTAHGGLIVLTPAEKKCNVPVTCNTARRDFLNGFVDSMEPPLCLVRSSHDRVGILWQPFQA